MNEIVNVVVYWVGVTICLAGGVILAAVMAGAAFDQSRALWKRIRG